MLRTGSGVMRGVLVGVTAFWEEGEAVVLGGRRVADTLDGGLTTTLAVDADDAMMSIGRVAAAAGLTDLAGVVTAGALVGVATA